MIKLFAKGNQQGEQPGIITIYQEGYVLVQVPPDYELNPVTVSRLWKTMADSCKHYNCNQALVEGTIRRSMTPTDVVESANQLFQNGLHDLRLAICWYDFEADTLSDLFIATAAGSGTQVRLCKNRTEAKEWLGIEMQVEGIDGWQAVKKLDSLVY